MFVRSKWGALWEGRRELAISIALTACLGLLVMALTTVVVGGS